MDFSNRNIVITGGTGALGSAVIDALLKAGAHCVVPYRHDTQAQNFTHRDNKAIKLVKVNDLSDENDVGKLYAGVSPLWASIHIAGAFAGGKVADTDKAALLKQLDANLISCFLCCHAAVKAMGTSGGRIVNVAARQALEWRHGAGASAYSISKAGVAALTTLLAEEVVKDGILVNAVAPSTMDTPANRASMPKADFDKWAKVEDVAATIVFLASPDNRVTRGGVVPVYGKS
jgi:NAD(P)-dependent dehydrogenase (short-subunit alcohol dehydrogenase family)